MKSGARLLLLPCLLIALPFVWIPDLIEPITAPRLFLLQLFNIVGMTLFLREGGWRWFPRPVLWLAALSAVIWLLPTFWAINREAALFAWLRSMLLFQLMFWGGYLNCRYHRQAMIPAVATLVGGLLSLIGLFQIFNIGDLPFEQHYPPSITFLNRNVAGELIAGLLPLTFAHLLLVRHRLALVGAILATALIAFFLIFSESRTAWVATLLCLIVVLANILVYPNHRRFVQMSQPIMVLQRVGMALALTAVLIGIWSQAAKPQKNPITEELKTFTRMGAYEHRKLNTVQVRLAMYLNSLPMIRDHLVTGVGLMNFAVHYPLYNKALRPTPSYSLQIGPEYLHNDILQLAVETGLVGVAAFLLLVWFVFTSRRSGDRPGLYVVHTMTRAMVLIFLICSSFSFSLHMTTPAVWLWLGFGLLLARPPVLPQAPPSARISIMVLIPVVLSTSFLISPILNGLALKRGLDEATVDLDKTQQYLEQAHNDFPADPRGLDRALTLAINRRQYPQALDLAEAFQKRNPYHPNGFWRKALVLYYLDRPTEAMTALDHAFQLCQPTGKMRYLRARLLAQLGREHEAETDLALVQEEDRELFAEISRWF